jgi:hypothetical protein
MLKDKAERQKTKSNPSKEKKHWKIDFFFKIEFKKKRKKKGALF